MRNTIGLTTFLGLLAFFTFSKLTAQVANPYQAYFEEAYQQFRDIPEGVLEAVAYNNTRLQHLDPGPEDASCQGLPQYHGVMGLVENGKGYFRNTLEVVVRNSRYSAEQIKSDPRINILAYAEAYSRMQRARLSNNQIQSRNIAAQGDVLFNLSEIPDDNSLLNRYARNQQFFSILKEMEDPHTGRKPLNSQRFNYRNIFPDPVEYNMLTSPSVRVETDRVRNFNNTESPFRCTSEERLADYDGAVWEAANTRNYGSRGGEPVKEITIHTIQGTYASAISWFKNPNARVSTHYVIRASDGQVTQMVCESDKAFHVKTDNATTIGIEHEGYIADGAAWYTQEMYESSARLVQDLVARHGIDPLRMFSGPPTDGIRTLSNACYRVKGHQHFRNNNHIDPGPFWDWERYYRLVNGDPEVQTLSQASGTLNLRNYEAGMRQGYLIDPPGNNPISLEFTSFDLEGTNNEPFDFIDIFDGENASGRFLGRFSGNRAPNKMTANSGKVYLEFRSDCRVNGAGFTLKYGAANVDVACSPLASATVQDKFALGATVGWQGGGSGKYVVKVRRKGITTAWTQFQTHETQFQLTGLAANTNYDWLVHSICANGNISAPVGGNFTTLSVGRAGSPQTYIITGSKGRFLDSGGSIAGYANNEAYIYSIRPKKSGLIRVEFSSFDTEKDFDLLSIYDGKGTDSRLLGTFSGNQIPRNIMSTGNSLTFKFVSDNRTQGRGWEASWELLQGNTPDPDDPDDPPIVVIPDNSTLEPVLKFPDREPGTDIQLDASYSKASFPVSFQDKHSTGRRPAYRFYTVVQQKGSEWIAQPDRGFLWEEFSGNLDENWEREKGTWQIKDNQLIQLDQNEGNTNIWREFPQKKAETYLYHWVGRMQGSSNNRRMGLHFFVSDPTKSQRGNSYFVWFRDSPTGDKAEIYETQNNVFKKRMEKPITLLKGEAYDFKVIYQPSNGRIEVYVNNDFIVSWTDPSPLTSGKAVSFRTGNTLITLDDFRIYKGRSNKATLTAGSDQGNDIVLGNLGRGGQRFRVYSLITNPSSRDTRRWSRLSMMESRFVAGDRDVPPDSGTPDTPETPIGGLNLRPAYSNDFVLELPDATGYFILPTYFEKKNWSAATNLGFFVEDFRGNKFREGWNLETGKWKQQNGRLVQTDEGASNGNIHIQVDQLGGDIFLYHWKSKLLTTGDNKRFGFHFFASDGHQSNRADSYMLWFRNYDSQGDRLEVYKSVNNNLGTPMMSSSIEIEPNTWYDIKVYFDSGRGIVWVYLDDQQVLSWQDLTGSIFSKAAFVSFRTGSAQVQFDDLRIYRQFPLNQAVITVGNRPTDMIRFQSSAKNRPVEIYVTRLGNDGSWIPVQKGETQIR